VVLFRRLAERTALGRSFGSPRTPLCRRATPDSSRPPLRLSLAQLRAGTRVICASGSVDLRPNVDGRAKSAFGPQQNRANLLMRQKSACSAECQLPCPGRRSLQDGASSAARASFKAANALIFTVDRSACGRDGHYWSYASTAQLRVMFA
jgi:hypothetical protein